MSDMAQTVTIPKAQADAVRAEIVRRFGINPEHVVAGSLVMDWDSEDASIRWEGRISLAADEAADLFTAALTPTPAPPVAEGKA
jgi:hypothetical protein